MKLHEILIKAQKQLNAATVEYEFTNEDLSVGHLIALQDFLQHELITVEPETCESAESSKPS